MKKWLIAALIAPLPAFAQTYPSPTFNNLTVQGVATFATTPTFSAPISVANGGTGAATLPQYSVILGNGTSALQSAGPSGTAGLPLLSGGATANPSFATLGLSALTGITANSVVANATGSSAAPTAVAMPSCSTSSSALQWTNGTGFVCNTSINATSLGGNAANTFAPLASPALAGTPTAPTATAGTNTTQVSTTAFVQSAISGMSSSTFGSLYLTWFNSLQTTLPGTAGVLWNNGGLLSKS